MPHSVSYSDCLRFLIHLNGFHLVKCSITFGFEV